MLKETLNISNYYLNPYALSVFFVGALILFIGLFVLKQNRKSAINIAFFYECASTGIWLLTISLVCSSRLQQVAIFWYRYFTFLAVTNIIPSLLVFTFSWTREFKNKKYFLILNIFASIIFYVLAITTDKIISPYDARRYYWGFYPIYHKWAFIFIAIFFMQGFYAFTKLYLAYKSEKSLIKKVQLGSIGIATFIGFTAFVDFIPKFFNIAFYPFGYISMFIYICLVAYSIVRYRTFDIETVIHKTVMWLLTFSFIIIPIFFLHKWLDSFMQESQLLHIGFWTLNLILLAVYLRAIQPKIDHFFQRRQSNLEEISNRFTEDLVHLKGLNQLIQRIEDTIADTLYSQQIKIFIYSEDKLKPDDQFIIWLAKHNKIVYREFIDIDPQYSSIKDTVKEYFDATQAIVVVPLVLNEKLLGIINLGKKANLRRYNAADFHFLTTLKNQSTIAISNSLLYENIEAQVRQRTKELIEVQQQLIQAEKLATVGTLAGGVAHEINNPLTAVLTNVQMLLAQVMPNDKNVDRESLELIEEATKRCRTIVQKLMAYAKKPLENAEISKVDLAKVIKNVTSFLSYQLEQENIQIITDVKADGYILNGNHNELEQAITNIILNAKDAIKRIKKSGQIKISLSKTGNFINIVIKDDGAGIPKEILSKIFDPFFTTKDVGKGLGLGLSICQSIIEKHGGMITVQSEVNNGSTFTVQLPKVETGVIAKSEV